MAIRNGLNHWDELGRFLDDVRIPLDDNAFERSLRRGASTVHLPRVQDHPAKKLDDLLRGAWARAQAWA